MNELARIPTIQPDPLAKAKETFRRMVSKYEADINQINSERDLEDRRLQAALDEHRRAAQDGEQELLRSIEENRRVAAEKMKVTSKLLDASHSALAALVGNEETVAPREDGTKAAQVERLVPKHVHKNING